MSNIYTASNGLNVEADEESIVINGVPGVEGKLTLVGPLVKALREFFQHERDQELGRWRWPENPDYVVYPHPDNDFANVLSEISGDSAGIYRDAARHTGSNFERAANAYFYVHPDTKPWHDARPGEVWELTYRSPSQNVTANRVMTCVDDGGNISFFNEFRLHTIHYTGIAAARRIWPEVSGDV